METELRDLLRERAEEMDVAPKLPRTLKRRARRRRMAMVLTSLVAAGAAGTGGVAATNLLRAVRPVDTATSPTPPPTNLRPRELVAGFVEARIRGSGAEPFILPAAAAQYERDTDRPLYSTKGRWEILDHTVDRPRRLPPREKRPNFSDIDVPSAYWTADWVVLTRYVIRTPTEDLAQTEWAYVRVGTTGLVIEGLATPQPPIGGKGRNQQRPRPDSGNAETSRPDPSKWVGIVDSSGGIAGYALKKDTEAFPEDENACRKLDRNGNWRGQILMPDPKVWNLEGEQVGWFFAGQRGFVSIQEDPDGRQPPAHCMVNAAGEWVEKR